MALTAGVARVDITPPIGVWLSGFGGRYAPSDGIRDELYSTALVLESDGQKAAIVGTDIIGVDVDLMLRIRELAAAWTAIDADHLLVNASHTHCGPATVRGMRTGQMDDAYCDVLARRIATAVAQADAARQPASLHYGSQHVAVSINRRQRKSDGGTGIGKNPGGPVDRIVRVLRVDGQSGRPLAIAFNCACHPVSLGGILKVSADYVGAAARTIEAGHDGQAPALFLQGCCGNINPASEYWAPDVGTPRMGEELGTAALEAAAAAQPIEATPIMGGSQQIDLPFQDPPSVDEAEATRQRLIEELREVKAEGNMPRIVGVKQLVAWADDLVTIAREGVKPRTEAMAVHALRIGDLAIAAGGAETHIESAMTIAEASPFEPTLVLGYTNGLIGYLPPAESYPEGGYEVDDAYRWYGRALMWRPQSESMFTRSVLDMLQRMR